MSFHRTIWDTVTGNQPEPTVGRHPAVRRIDSANIICKKAIDTAERYGLPVNFLRAVQTSRYKIGKGRYDMTDLRVSKITFTENTLKELMDLNANNPLEGSVDLAILYHEFTHAYFVLMKDNVEFRKVIQDGIAHYTGAILENGRQIEKDSASRAFSGAAAGYVQIHVFCWLLYVPYYKVLSAFTSHLSGQVIIPFEISRLLKEYNNHMKQSAVG